MIERPESIQGLRQSESTATLEAKCVGKRYRLGGDDRWVLRDVNFSVSSGECSFLAGPSGSGKSTLLSILGCLLTPDAGEVLVQGRSVQKLSNREQTTIRRELIGFVFQKFQLIRGLSAAENVAIPLTLLGVPGGTALKRAADMLGRVGLYDFRNSLPTRMSPGQCQRVAIARAVVNSPRVVLADEPTASLDAKSGMESMKILKQLVQEAGAAAVVVTHDSRIFEFADRIYHMNNGSLEHESVPMVNTSQHSANLIAPAVLMVPYPAMYPGETV
jgi:putative ABC transport system ATP-binding protein